eukprot:SAG31_NODE_2597_length_5420_cov_16.255403_4_plen_125_part_00
MATMKDELYRKTEFYRIGEYDVAHLDAVIISGETKNRKGGTCAGEHVDVSQSANCIKTHVGIQPHTANAGLTTANDETTHLLQQSDEVVVLGKLQRRTSKEERGHTATMIGDVKLASFAVKLVG